MNYVRLGMQANLDCYARDMGILMKEEWFEKMVDYK